MKPGNYFCKVDLHVHTPASECFTETGITPEMLVNQAIESGMKAIAITDHNSAEWVDRIKQAAADTELTVFPGVEIAVQPGVHVVAIFPEDRKGSHVTDLLSELGLKTDDRGKNNSLVNKFSVQEVVSIIRHQHNALPILAHIDGEKGAWKELRNHGQTLLQLWQAHEFAAVEIVGETLPAEVGKDPFIHIPACYWASDNPHPDNPVKHSHLGIGSRYSRFKLADPINWEGLRLCFHDSEMRIRPASEEEISHPVIEEVKIEGGFLDNANIEFNPNLNCVIGGRGTGKSCLLELLRYAFDVPAKTDSNTIQSSDLVSNTFPPGSRIIIRFRQENGAGYILERSISQPPKIYREDSDQILNLHPTDLLQVQIYGQKEVFEISKDPAFQLKLFDNYLADDLEPLSDKENNLLLELGENAANILRLDEQIQAAEQQIGKIGAVEEEIRQMEKQDFVNRLKTKSQFDQEHELINDTQSQVTNLIDDLVNFLDTHRLNSSKLEEEYIGELPNKEILAELKRAIQEMNNNLKNDMTALHGKIDAIWQSNQPTRNKWRANYEKQNELYEELLRIFRAEGKLLKPEKFVELKNEQRRLNHLAKDTEARNVEIASLREKRSELLIALRHIRKRQYETRNQKAQQLTQELGVKIRISMWPQGHRKIYQEKLEKLFEGTRTRKGSSTVNRGHEHHLAINAFSA